MDLCLISLSSSGWRGWLATMDGTNMIRAGLLIFILFVMKVTSQKLDGE